jgi:uncharacterized protein YbjT (DUF2867 family)
MKTLIVKPSKKRVETILVTGATGTVGREVVNQLSNLKSDFKIKAAVRSVENAKKIENFQRVEHVQIDYETQEGLRAAFKETDKFFFAHSCFPQICRSRDEFDQ